MTTTPLFTYAPISDWTGFNTETRRPNPFRATWTDTLRLLTDELAHLDATNIVVELDLQFGQIRRDGMPRADAKVGSPAVRLTFQSSVGPLTYATDRYEGRWSNDPADWQINLRAIALGLEALRKVERYGITRRGEQYAGFRGLPAGRGEPASGMTPDEARAVIQEVSGVDAGLPGGHSEDRAARRAKAAAHPDRHDGDRTLWDQVEQAAAVLGLA